MSTPRSMADKCNQCHRHRQVRDENVHPDRDERQHRVEERRDERPEGQLGAAVPDERPQHPRPELLGDASVSVTIMIENTTPTTVMIDPRPG